MFTLKNTIITILLILAAILSSWSIYISTKSKATTLTDSKRPDAYMENIITTIINKEGVRSLLIESPRMTHYAEDDTTVIEAPHITVYRESPEPWHINSDYAKATQGTDKIYFWSNVVIQHPHDETMPLTTFKTASLTVFLEEKIAKTDDAVVLSQPETKIYAVGMMANLHDGEIKLLSQTRGEYAPPP